MIENKKQTKVFIADKCSHCNQFVNYEISLSRGFAICLIKIYNYIQEKGVNAVHLDKELLEKGILSSNDKGNVPKLRHWGLIDQLEESGNYAINQRTIDFLKNGLVLPKKVIVLKGVENDFGGFWDIQDTVTLKSLLKKDNPYWEGDYIKYGNIIN